MNDNKLFTGSICYTDLVQMMKTGKYRGIKSERNGKVYININVWLNSEPDQYGNDGAIQLQPKEEFREERLNRYVGNIKEYKRQEPKEAAVTDFDDSDDDMPF